MILVTGASEGIGLACARVLLERTEARVLITGRSEDKLARARATLPVAVRSRLCTLRSDQSRVEDLEELIGKLDAVESIDGAVLTVGANPMYDIGPQRIHALDPATIESTIRTNCTHTMRLSSALLERMRRQRRGAIVWIGSQAAAAGLPGAALYCATKSFLSGLARAARNEYGRLGIRTHLTHPGLVRTPRTARVADAFAARHARHVSEPVDAARQIVDLLLDGDANAVEVDLR